MTEAPAESERSAPPDADPDDRSRASLGTAYAVAAYLAWGLFPAFFHLVRHVDAIEVLAHRVVWSLAIGVAVAVVAGRARTVWRTLGDRRLLGRLCLAAAIISVNWGVFIWAIGAGRVLESSLGYYINPLVSVLLGVIVLGERMRRVQWAAIALAAAGVAYQVVGVGQVPWVSLTLAVSFGTYGLIRKVTPVEPLVGLVVETLVLAPLAVVYLLVLEYQGLGVFGHLDGRTDALLVLSGAVTAGPLLLFVAGARRIRLSTLGLLQYIVPTGHFLLAVFAFAEPFDTGKLITFACVWAALALYTGESLRRARPAR